MELRILIEGSRRDAWSVTRHIFRTWVEVRKRDFTIRKSNWRLGFRVSGAMGLGLSTCGCIRRGWDGSAAGTPVGEWRGGCGEDAAGGIRTRPAGRDLRAMSWRHRPESDAGVFVQTRRTLAPHISLEANPLARVDVHGNQVALLEKSRCFQSSASMTCSTCHKLHEPEREAAAYSDKCLTCHQASACPTFSKMPAPAVTNCIDCHMPLQESNSLEGRSGRSASADQGAKPLDSGLSFAGSQHQNSER